MSELFNIRPIVKFELLDIDIDIDIDIDRGASCQFWLGSTCMWVSVCA